MFLSSNSHVDPEVKSLHKSIALKLVGTQKYGSVGVLTIYASDCRSPAFVCLGEVELWDIMEKDFSEQIIYPSHF